MSLDAHATAKTSSNDRMRNAFGHMSAVWMPSAAFVLAIDSVAFFTIPVNARMASIVGAFHCLLPIA